MPVCKGLRIVPLHAPDIERVAVAARRHADIEEPPQPALRERPVARLGAMRLAPGPAAIALVHIRERALERYGKQLVARLRSRRAEIVAPLRLPREHVGS